MKISARNIIAGTVKQIREGMVNDEVVLSIAGGNEIVSVVTKASVERLGLKVGSKAYAVVKSSDVMLAID